MGSGDRSASENMYTVIQQALRRANSSHTIGNALIYECVRTMTTIYPNPVLLAAAAEAVAAFLRSTSHNLRYVGIDALAGIVKINPQYAQVRREQGVQGGVQEGCIWAGNGRAGIHATSQLTHSVCRSLLGAPQQRLNTLAFKLHLTFLSYPPPYPHRSTSWQSLTVWRTLMIP